MDKRKDRSIVSSSSNARCSAMPALTCCADAFFWQHDPRKVREKRPAQFVHRPGMKMVLVWRDRTVRTVPFPDSPHRIFVPPIMGEGSGLNVSDRWRL